MPDRILVIDDAPEIHKLVKFQLGLNNVELLSALDGAAGLQAACEHQPDLILLDIDMPGQDGFEVCAQLKAQPDTREIPVIFLSAASASVDKIRGLDLGANDFVTKPFDPAELYARVRASLRMRRLIDLLAKKVMVDGLTGLWNRAYLDANLEVQMAAARRTGQPLACIMSDIDHFKRINDAYGHSFGDDVIREVATVMIENCRTEDIVCRYGGEEFTILSPHTPLERAAELADRLRRAIERRPLQRRDASVRVTCSFGVAQFDDDARPSILELADDALYQAKRRGRNRVEVCTQPASASV